MKKFFLFISIFILLILGALFIFLPKNKPTRPPESSKIVIATTIFPLYDIVQNITGDHAIIVPLLSGDKSAHDIQLTPELEQKAIAANIIFKIGNGLDDWSDGLKKNPAENGKIIPVSEDIKLQRLSDGSIDPHYWLSLPNAMIMTQTITKYLIEIDPSNKDYYQTNEAIYLKKLQAADNEIKEKMSSLPKKELVVFHNAWGYFSERYGLKIIDIYEKLPGKEPTTRQRAHFIETLHTHHLTTLFYEPQFSSISIKQLAQKEKLAIDLINPMENGGDATSDSYIAIMKETADKIYQALASQK